MTAAVPLLALAATLLAVPSLMRPTNPAPPSEIRGGMRFWWWFNRLHARLIHRLDAPRMAPLPVQGPALLVSNHTCGADPVILQATCRRVLGFLIAREFAEHWLVGPMSRTLGCIPVKRDGQDAGAARSALKALKQGRVVPIFPEGTIVPTSGREFGPGKPGAAFLVLHSKVPVIPAYISGTPPTENVWKALFTPSHSRVVYGDPIDPSHFSGDARNREDLDAVTAQLMAAIRELKEGSAAKPA